MCKLNVLNERLLGLGLFILVLCIKIQIVYKSCTFNCNCGYWCTAVILPSTAAYSLSLLLAVFQGHVATFPLPPVYWIVRCLMVHYTAPHSLRVHCLALYFTECAALHSALPCAALYCTLLHCTARHLSALPVLHCATLYCTGRGGGDAACGAGTLTTALTGLYKSDVLFINYRFI